MSSSSHWTLYITCGVCGTDVAIPSSDDYTALVDKLATLRLEHTPRQSDGRCGCGVPHCVSCSLLTEQDKQ